MNMKKSMTLMVGIIIVLAGLDVLSKLLIVANLPLHHSITIIPNFLSITHHRNYGIAWGQLQGATTFLIMITLVAFAMFAYLAKDIDFKTRRMYSIAITLLFAGAIGNFIDRIRWGYVVDFINFTNLFGYNFPIFNVADSCLTIGMIAFAIDMLWLEPKRVKNHEENL